MRRKFAAQVKKKYLLHFNCVNYVRAYFGGFAPCGLSTLLDFGARGSKSTTGQKVSWLKSKIDFDRILQKPFDFRWNRRVFSVFVHFSAWVRYGSTCSDPYLTQTSKISGSAVFSSGTPCVYCKSTANLFSDGLGDELPHPISGLLAHLPGDVGVGVQREPRAVMAQDA